MDKTPDPFQTYFSKMPVPRFIAEMRGRDQFAIVQANDLALKYFDRKQSQVLGKKIQDVMDADNAQHFGQSFEVCVSKKRPVTIQALPGVPSPIRVYGFYISPIMDETGRVSYLDVIGQLDVADQSILQRERDDAISMMTSIFEVGEIGILLTDHNGRIVKVNESFIRMFGWSREELINADVVGLVTPDEREAVRRAHMEYIRSGARGTGEIKMIRKEGSIANSLFTAAMLELSQKRRFLVTTIMDITLRKQMEESLRFAKNQADSANRAKSTFLANMSHELRTPMNAIIGFSEMMIKEIFGALGHPKYKEYLQDVHASGVHLLEIINEVLDMSKIEAGRIELDEGEVGVKDLIFSVTRMMASRAFASNVTYKEKIADDLMNLIADQRLVRQILINLVGNATKFSRPGGLVDVSAHMLDDGRMQIIVADNGIGIPKDRIKQAMEPFGQVSDHPEQAKYQGTGLGLPLARAMVELHDGTLSLDSEVGKGTTVFVTFPAYRSVPRRAIGLKPGGGV